MPKKLKRYYGRGDLHFITFSCYRRLPLLGRVRTRNLFVKALKEVRERYGFVLIGYVLMPEHVHLLIGEPRKGTPSDTVKALKQGVSRRARAKRGKPCVPASQLELPFREGPGVLPQFWQRRFYDFNVWSAKKVREKLEYMHRNPVARGLIGHPKSGGGAVGRFITGTRRVFWRWTAWDKRKMG